MDENRRSIWDRPIKVLEVIHRGQMIFCVGCILFALGFMAYLKFFN